MEQTNNKSLLGTTSAIIAPFFLWGTAMVAMKGVIPHTTPYFMAGFRLVPAGILILIAAMIMKRPQPRSIKAIAWIILFAIIDGTLFQGFLAQGLVRTTAGLGSVMIDSQPLVVAILSWLLFQEKINLIGWVGLSIGIGGISLIGLSSATINLDGLFNQGEWLMLFAALSMAVGTILIRYVCRYADPIVATGWHMIIGGVPLFILSANLESDQWNQLDLSNWLALSYATIFGSAIAYGLFFYFAARGNLTSLSALTFLTPVFALLFGNILLNEVLNQSQWIGVGLTLVSIYLINQRELLAQWFFSLDYFSASSKAVETVKIDKDELL